MSKPNEPIVEALQFLTAERRCREHADFETAGLLAAKQLTAIGRIQDPAMRGMLHELRDYYRAHLLELDDRDRGLQAVHSQVSLWDEQPREGCIAGVASVDAAEERIADQAAPASDVHVGEVPIQRGFGRPGVPAQVQVGLNVGIGVDTHL